MITTDQLKTNLFCSRKLFLQAILKLPQERTKVDLKQVILNEALRYTNRAEPGLIKSINEQLPEKYLAERYHKSNHRSLQEALLNHKEAIAQEGLSIIELHKDLWADLKKATQARIQNTQSYMEKHRIHGQDLWRALQPKITFALNLEANNLKTTIYRLDNYEHDAKPYIITKQQSPKYGVWPSHKYHLASMMLSLASQGLIVQEGVVLYDEGKAPRTLHMTPELEQDTKERLKQTQATLENNQLPERVTNTKKCEHCTYKAQCYDDAYMAARTQELKEKA